MKTAILILLAVGSVSFAQTGAGVIESLLARRWIPFETQIQWTGATREALDLDSQLNWEIVSPQTTQPCGAMILKLAATDSSGLVRSVTVSGNANVLVNCLTANRTLLKGAQISSDVAAEKFTEWKAAYGEPLTKDALNSGLATARTIGAGRPICRDDVLTAESVQTGERVIIRVTQGAIDVTVPGRALSHGGIGQEVSAMTLLRPSRTFRGVVESKGMIHVELP